MRWVKQQVGASKRLAIVFSRHLKTKFTPSVSNFNTFEKSNSNEKLIPEFERRGAEMLP